MLAILVAQAFEPQTLHWGPPRNIRHETLGEAFRVRPTSFATSDTVISDDRP
jgi:hypothetical protein